MMAVQVVGTLSLGIALISLPVLGVLGQCPSQTSVSPIKSISHRGDLTTLRCLTPDSQPLTNPRFFKNGEEIEYGGNFILRISSFFEIRSVSFEDEGNYTCLPESACGDSAQQNIGSLLVHPERDLNSRRSYSVSEGSDATLDCGLMFGSLNRTQVIEWTNSRGMLFATSTNPVSGGGKYVFNPQTFQLTIKSATSEDEHLSAFGGYICKTLGSSLFENTPLITANEVELQVIKLPIVRQKSLLPGAAILGSSVTGSCTIEWVDTVGEVQWYIGDRLLQGFSYDLSMEMVSALKITYRVTVVQTRLEDSGTLICRAISTRGALYTSGQQPLLVLYEPSLRVDNKLAVVHFSVSSPSTFTLLLYALPVKEYSDPSRACRGEEPFHEQEVPASGAQNLTIDFSGGPESDVQPGTYIIAIQMAGGGVVGPCVLSSETSFFGTAMNTLSSGEIAGIVVAIIVAIVIFVIVIGLLICCCWRLRGSKGNLVLALSPTPERENTTKRRNYSSSVPSLQSFKESLLSLNKSSHHTSHYELSLENAYVKHSYDRSTSVADSWSYSPKFEPRAETFPRLPNLPNHAKNEGEFVVSTFPRSGPSFTAGMEPPSRARAQSMGSMYEVPVGLHRINSDETGVGTPSTNATEGDMV